MCGTRPCGWDKVTHLQLPWDIQDVVLCVHKHHAPPCGGGCGAALLSITVSAVGPPDSAHDPLAAAEGFWVNADAFQHVDELVGGVLGVAVTVTMQLVASRHAQVTTLTE